MAPLLQAENVSMSFGGVKALSDVSFDLHQGEILGLIGPERRREDDDVQLHHRRPAGLPRAHPLRRTRPPAPQAARAGAAQDRAHLPEPRAVRRAQCSRQPARPARRLLAARPDRRSPPAADDRARRAQGAGEGAVDPPLPEPRRLRRHARRRPAGRSAATRSRSDARSASSRGCCCWTSRRPGSTRGRPPSWRGCSRRCGPGSRSPC